MCQRETEERQPDGLPRERGRHLSGQGGGLSGERHRGEKQGLDTGVRGTDVGDEPEGGAHAGGRRPGVYAGERQAAEHQPEGVLMGCGHLARRGDSRRPHHSQHQTHSHLWRHDGEGGGYADDSCRHDALLPSGCGAERGGQAGDAGNGREECRAQRRPHRPHVRLPALRPRAGTMAGRALHQDIVQQRTELYRHTQCLRRHRMRFERGGTAQAETLQLGGAQLSGLRTADLPQRGGHLQHAAVERAGKLPLRDWRKGQSALLHAGSVLSLRCQKR